MLSSLVPARPSSCIFFSLFIPLVSLLPILIHVPSLLFPHSTLCLQDIHVAVYKLSDTYKPCTVFHELHPWHFTYSVSSATHPPMTTNNSVMSIFERGRLTDLWEFLRDTWLEMELLGYNIYRFLIWLKATRLFTRMATTVYTSHSL